MSKDNIDESNFEQIVGGSEHTLRAKLTFSQESHGTLRACVCIYIYIVCIVYLSIFVSQMSVLGHAGNLTKESGPVSMTFTIPMYNASKLQVIKYLC